VKVPATLGAGIAAAVPVNAAPAAAFAAAASAHRPAVDL
jgi:hypothetical protein